MHAWGVGGGSCGQVCAHGQRGGSVFCRGEGGGTILCVLSSEQRPLGSNPLSVESIGKAFLTEVKALRLGPACHWGSMAKVGKYRGKCWERRGSWRAGSSGVEPQDNQDSSELTLWVLTCPYAAHDCKSWSHHLVILVSISL